jgi:hypothetical protein
MTAIDEIRYGKRGLLLVTSNRILSFALRVFIRFVPTKSWFSERSEWTRTISHASKGTRPEKEELIGIQNCEEGHVLERSFIVKLRDRRDYEGKQKEQCCRRVGQSSNSPLGSFPSPFQLASYCLPGTLTWVSLIERGWHAVKHRRPCLPPSILHSGEASSLW